MKPFNLEEYLANPAKKLITRDGRKVKRVLCTDVKGKYPIVVVIENSDDNTEQAISLTKDGKYLDSGSDNKDLFFATEKHEGWVNVYMNYNEHTVGALHSSKEDALEVAKVNDNYLTTVKIEWKE